MENHREYRDHRDELGKQLLTLRTRAALTQSGLAEQVGVHRRSVQNWETGMSYPKAELLQRLIEVFLSQRTFTLGHEREEAYTFWRQAAQEGPHTIAAFDEIWFARTLACHAPAPAALVPPRLEPAMIRAIIDWGEAMAVPMLYGRNDELETLHQWVVGDRCRVVSVVGIGGIGKSSLAITLAHQVLAQFDVVLFRSLQNAPTLADVLDQTIRAIAVQSTTLPKEISDKIALLVRLFRERRCLLVLDNFEAILQPGELTGTYRTGYAEYGSLLQWLGEREHGSCLVLTSREKPAELGPLEGRTTAVRTLSLAGLDERACHIILESKDIVGTPDEVRALTELYGGNPLALQLVAEPIRELFGNDIAAFLATGDAYFAGLGTLMIQQCARSTPLEHAILFWLAIERELVPVSRLLANLGNTVPQRAALSGLESLRRRMQIERGPHQPAFTLQPVILEHVTDKLLTVICEEIVDGNPWRLLSHALIQATAKDYVRSSQERLIATPLLERLLAIYGNPDAVAQRFLTLLESWRDQPLASQGYGPGNILNLLRLLRGQLRGLDLTRLLIRQAYLQGVELQDANLAGATLQDGVFTETFDAILAVAISRNGAYWAASSRSGEVLVWNASDLNMHWSWRAHANMIWTLAFSPDGRRIATGGWDGTVKLWDVISGKLLWSGRHTSHVNSVAFAPDGSTLASGGNDATVRLWDLRTGTQIQTLSHPGPVSGSGVTWNHDGRLLASGDMAGTIRVWAIHGTEPASCVQTIACHTGVVDGLSFAPDGNTLASTSWDGTVKLWDASSGRLRQDLVGHTGRVGRVAWTPDGRTLAVSGYDPTIWLWDIEAGRYRATLQGHTDGVCGLAFMPDGRSLLSCGNGTLRVCDALSGQCTRVIQGYEDFLYMVDWSPDGSQLVSGGMDGLVTIWDASDGRPTHTLRGHIGSVCGVGWSVDGRWLASSEWENTIRLWNPTTGDCLQVLQHPDDPGNFFYGVAWSPDGRRLASGTSRRGMLVWDVVAHRPLWIGQHIPTFIRHVVWHPDGTQVAGGGDDGILYLWNAADGTLLRRLVGHHSMITSVAWSPDGTRLASGGRGIEGGELFVWDVQRGERVNTTIGHAGIVYALAWGAHADVLVSGGGDGMLRWWDVQRGACLRVRAAHHGTVQSLRRRPDGIALASCGDDGTIILWDTERGTQIQTLRRDRPYERLDITETQGLTEAQTAALRALGAIDRSAPITPTQIEQDGNDRTVAAINLPFQSTPCIGRSTELAEISRILSDPACRLLTLLGPGGIGKTRLALEVAAHGADAFSDGVAFVALADVDDAKQIVSVIGETIMPIFAGQSDPTAHLLTYLRERRMLLVLDNFEHLLGGAALIATILAGAPHVTILVTSRERLNVQAEWLFDVEGLAYPPVAAHDLAALADYSAIQLFIQRAAQIQPGLPLPEAAFATIARICQHVAGMPLAIELAAAGVRTLSVAEIERQIRVSFDALATSFRDVPARHRSMRAVFNHSWALLNEAERTLFSRLAIFRGGWTTEAANAICMQDQRQKIQGDKMTSAVPLLPFTFYLLPLLTALVDKSLVRQIARQAQTVTEPRYMLLEPIREYALEQLAVRGEMEMLQHAHAHYYMTLAEGVAAQWENPNADVAIAQLDRERDNMLAALQWASHGGDVTLGLQLGGALRKFWRRRGAISEGRGWLEELLALSDDSSDRDALAVRLRALEGAGWLAADQHEYDRARQFFEQGMALRRVLGQTEAGTNLLGNAALEARTIGQYRRATALLEDTLAQQRAIGDRGSLSSAGLGLTLFLLAMVRREQGDFAQAAALYNACIDFHSDLRDREGMAIGVLGLGDIARDGGNVIAMRSHTAESLGILRELDVQWAIGFALNNLALAAYLEGDLPQALAYIRESIAMFRAQNADGSLAEVLITLGQIVRVQGDRMAAYAAQTEALQFAVSVGPRLMAAAALEELASLLLQSQVDQTVRLLAVAALLRTQMGTPARPVDQPTVEYTLASARSKLGADAFAAMWAEAEQTPLEDILSTLPGTAEG